MGDYVAVDRDALLGVRFLAETAAEAATMGEQCAALVSLVAAVRAMTSVDLVITAVTAAPAPEEFGHLRDAPEEIGHNRQAAARAAGVSVDLLAWQRETAYLDAASRPRGGPTGLPVEHEI